MRLGFDVDEVICALCDVMVEWMNNEYGIDWCAEDFKIFALDKNIYSEDLEFNDKITAGLLDLVFDLDFQSTAEPTEGAPEFIKELKKRGHSIHYITCRKHGAEDVTAKWLREHNIPFDSVHHLGATLNVEKGMLGRALNLDFYMDDLEKHLLSMYVHKKRWRKGLMLWTRPWNEYSLDTSKFARADKWADVLRHLGIHKR
jgi:uncharacterized HAD superfamily protein